METKRAKVIMLPTKDNTGIFKDIGNSLFYVPKYDKDGEYQHLYITTDDKIKEGDWVLDNRKGCNNFIHQISCILSGDVRKIISTTDKSLWEHDDTVPYPKTRPALPQPSQAFINKYVEEYNKGNQIVDIDVEYESKTLYTDTGYLKGFVEDVKIDKHNTITIHPIKDSWSREEVEELLSYATHKRSCDQSAFGYHQKPCNCGLDKWIEENL